tara:strand:- start:8641 stop:8766 length:126 start_codon:yes stop_codon:yes gene_type:complete
MAVKIYGSNQIDFDANNIIQNYYIIDIKAITPPMMCMIATW